MMHRLASALMLLTVASCGDSASGKSTPSEFDRFIGTWTISAGMIVATCTGLPPINTPLMGDQTVQKGTAADVRRVAEHVRTEVRRRSGVELVFEVEFAGDWSGWSPEEAA